MADQEGLARMAAARLVAYGWDSLTGEDRAALRAFPEQMPDFTPAPVTVLVDDRPVLHESHEREAEMYGECITCAMSEAAPAGLAAGRARARDGAERADEHADPAWQAAARAAVLAIPIGTRFTTDRVWGRVPACHEPRAIGAVIQRLAREGHIVSTEQWEQSERSEAHARPVLVWRRERPR